MLEKIVSQVNDFVWNPALVVVGYHIQDVPAVFGLIFLPAAGFRDGYDGFFPGTSGFYWSSENNLDYSSWFLGFSESPYVSGGLDRYRGASIRPVW